VETWSGKSVMNVFASKKDNKEILLICPNCGTNCTHILYVGSLLGADKDEGNKPFSGTVAVGKTPYPHAAVQITLSCEGCDQYFALIIQKMKGLNLVKILVDSPNQADRARLPGQEEEDS